MANTNPAQTYATSQVSWLNDSNVIVFCDLDRTLTPVDVFHEQLIQRLIKSPLSLFSLLNGARHGRAELKKEVAAKSSFVAAQLPYNLEVIQFLYQRKQAGQKLVLCSAASPTIVEKVFAHLNIFDSFLTCETADNKAEAIQAAYPNHPFAYIGDSEKDLKVWKNACGCVAVTSHKKILKELHDIDPKAMTFSPPKAGLKSFLKLIRPRHWVKNLLIFTPALLAHQFNDSLVWTNAVLAFLVFCLTASSIYVFNDILDTGADREHHKKKERPVAAGAISAYSALLLGSIFLLTSFSLAGLFLPIEVLVVMGLYVLLNVGYSVHFKREVGLDVFILSSFYLLRIFLGSASTGTAISSWFLGFSLFLFFSLALLKRFLEVPPESAAKALVSSGRGYLNSDRMVLLIFGLCSSVCSVLVLALYINQEETRQHYGHPQGLYALCPILLLWFLRLWIYAGRGEVNHDPIAHVTTDKMSYALLALGAFIFLYSL